MALTSSLNLMLENDRLYVEDKIRQECTLETVKYLESRCEDPQDKYFILLYVLENPNSENAIVNIHKDDPSRFAEIRLDVSFPIENVRALVENKILNINQEKRTSRTILHDACIALNTSIESTKGIRSVPHYPHVNLDYVRELIRLGANLEKQDDLGRTPICYAPFESELFKMLLLHSKPSFALYVSNALETRL